MVFTHVNSSNASRHKYLLIVDGDKSSSSKLKALLKQFRYKVLAVNTAADAFELCDIVMPSLVVTRQVDDMPNIDFIRAFKRQEGSAGSAVLVVRNGKEDVDERACLAAGALTCLRLPLHVETLYRTIQVAIEPAPRMNLRINTTLSVVVIDGRINGAEKKFATALSENGLYLLTQDIRPLNTTIPLTFEVAGKAISADARVIYAHRPGNQTNFKPGMGMQFVRISDQDQEQIRLFIREEVKRGISAAP
jgi:DNA-binding response OmpR family regulator